MDRWQGRFDGHLIRTQSPRRAQRLSHDLQRFLDFYPRTHDPARFDRTHIADWKEHLVSTGMPYKRLCDALCVVALFWDYLVANGGAETQIARAPLKPRPRELSLGGIRSAWALICTSAMLQDVTAEYLAGNPSYKAGFSRATIIRRFKSVVARPLGLDWLTLQTFVANVRRLRPQDIEFKHSETFGTEAQVFGNRLTHVQPAPFYIRPSVRNKRGYTRLRQRIAKQYAGSEWNSL